MVAEEYRASQSGIQLEGEAIDQAGEVEDEENE
jgi:hypothetical protein